MDKLTTYGNYIVEILESYLHPGLDSPIHEHLIIDREHHHYQFMREGWVEKNTFQMGIVLHFSIKPDGKIWIQENQTDVAIDDELLKRGVPAKDIVLGMQPPAYRQFTEFAVG